MTKKRVRSKFLSGGAKVSKGSSLPGGVQAWDVNGSLRPGWVLDAKGTPKWRPGWAEKDREVLQRSLDSTSARIEELEIKLKLERSKIERSFFAGLKEGELLEIVGFQPKQSFYSPGGSSSMTYFEVVPELVPGDIVMYLGWVHSPGEEVSVKSSSGEERVLRLEGPKWLIREKVYIASIPSGLLQPYELEIDSGVVRVLEAMVGPKKNLKDLVE